MLAALTRRWPAPVSRALPLASAAASPPLAPTPLLAMVRTMAKRAANTMKRRYRGLYDGKHIMFGNKVSHAHNKCAAARTRTRCARRRAIARTAYPNRTLRGGI